MRRAGDLLIVCMSAFFAGGSCVAHADTTINVAGDCNFIVVDASLVLSEDFQFNDDCADPKWIREEYTRLFGAGGVPSLMILQEAGGRYEEGLGNGFLVQSFRDSAFDLISAETIDFWNSEWPHANAAALTNMPLWTKYSGSLYFFYWSQLLNVSNSKRDLFCFIGSEPLLAQGEAFELPVHESAANERFSEDCGEAREEAWKREKLQVGFTFLTLENASTKPIDEIEIVYRYYKESGLTEQIEQLYGIRSSEDIFTTWETGAAIDASIDAAPENANIHEFMLEKLGDKDLVEFKSRKAEPQTRKIAALAPGEKVIILLNVFYSDESLNFLPGYFVDGNVFVEKLVFRAGSRTVSRLIRDPYGEQAARKSLSWGWGGQ